MTGAVEVSGSRFRIRLMNSETHFRARLCLPRSLALRCSSTSSSNRSTSSGPNQFRGVALGFCRAEQLVEWALRLPTADLVDELSYTLVLAQLLSEHSAAHANLEVRPLSRSHRERKTSLLAGVNH